MVNVFLHGMLGRKFGKEWRGIHASNASEALHAIDINTKGLFRQYLAQHPQRQYKIKIGERFVEEDVEVTGPSGNQDIHLTPVVKGRNSGWGKIFAAIAIVALMWWNPGGWAAAGGMFQLSGSLTAAGTIAASASAALFIGGVSQLLAPKVNFDGPKDQRRANSFTFGGNVDAVRQGHPVPVAYGRVLINPLPISISFFHEDYTAGGIATPPDVTSTTDENYTSSTTAAPPNNPVGQLVSVSANTPQYFGKYTDTRGTTTLPPSEVRNEI